jgi:hypothetical protein
MRSRAVTSNNQQMVRERGGGQAADASACTARSWPMAKMGGAAALGLHRGQSADASACAARSRLRGKMGDGSVSAQVRVGLLMRRLALHACGPGRRWVGGVQWRLLRSRCSSCARCCWRGVAGSALAVNGRQCCWGICGGVVVLGCCWGVVGCTTAGQKMGRRHRCLLHSACVRTKLM